MAGHEILASVMKGIIYSMLPAVCACVCLAEEPAQEQITIHEGETVTRVLDGNPTTGYLWKAEQLPEDAAVKVETAILPAEKGKCPLCGAPSPTQVTITAVKPGTSTVVVNYARPWEKDQEPARTVRYKVTVLPKE